MRTLEFHFSDIEISIFKELGVGAIILFGSRALGLARETSDYDFGVLLNGAGLEKLKTERGKLFDTLHDIFSSHIKRLINIDVVFLQTASGELQVHAMKKGQVLYEEKSGVFADFIERVMLEYADFAPLRYIFHQGILSRIS
ncbi:MAG: nucleotidyltransferase domain-containing protein [bacterium]|nr:nucleotidyltransferase domain-containing protein [bacterium]